MITACVILIKSHDVKYCHSELWGLVSFTLLYVFIHYKYYFGNDGSPIHSGHAARTGFNITFSMFLLDFISNYGLKLLGHSLHFG